MEDEVKHPKKKRSKKSGEVPASFEALAKLTSSDVIRQVKIGMSKIAPLENESFDPLDPEESGS